MPSKRKRSFLNPNMARKNRFSTTTGCDSASCQESNEIRWRVDVARSSFVHEGLLCCARRPDLSGRNSLHLKKVWDEAANRIRKTLSDD